MSFKTQYENYVKENKIQVGTVLKVIPQERHDFKNLLIVRLKEDVEVKSIYDCGYMSYHIKFLELPNSD